MVARHPGNRSIWLATGPAEVTFRANMTNQDMERALQLAVIVFAALATGGLMINWIGLGRAMSRLSASNAHMDPKPDISLAGVTR